MGGFEVLLASDFTARSDRPLDRAAQIAEQRCGSLVIVHVLEKSTDAPEDHVVERLRADLPDALKDAELVVRPGSAPKELAALAAERGSDLIVTGVARYNSLGDYFLGTAVDNIIRSARQPVLIVRRRPTAPYDRLLVATDLSDCSRDALLAAASMFPHAAITLVHAFHVPYEGWLKSDDVKADFQAEAEEGVEAFLAGLEPAVRARLDARLIEGEIGAVVVNALSETHADLLVLGTHGRSGFSHATMGSHAESLLGLVNVDVLIVREQEVIEDAG